jgi:hypothetical protein
MHLQQQVSTEQYAFSRPLANACQRRHHMFPLTSANIAQTLGHGPSARFGRPATASAIIVAAAIALFAFAHTPANAAENSPGMAQEQRACAVVLGLDPSEDSYETCVRVFNRNLSQWRPSVDQDDWARYNQACAEVGIDPGSPIFLQCVTDLDHSLWAVQNFEKN